MEFAIVAIGYNRPKALLRLLSSLNDARYDQEVSLFISLDKSAIQEEMISAVSAYQWSHGPQTIIAREERMGLREHVLSCGDLVESFDALIMFEDDIVVSESFFAFAKQACNFYKDDERIAGISLYKHETHPGVYRPFVPMKNEYDCFLMQFAQSWGQCWTREMWRSFRKWYEVNEKLDLARDQIIPDYIASWNKQSWLKYFMRYVAENNKFFVYPYYSLSTNASDVGEHNSVENNDFQVAMQIGQAKYQFPDFENAIKYDIYFERINLQTTLNIPGSLLLDLYGSRTCYENFDYVASTKALPFKIEKKIHLKYRPMEYNLIRGEEGEGIYIYDLHAPERIPKIDNRLVVRFDVRARSFKGLLALGFQELVAAVCSKINRLVRR